jgi:hypothetical protein
MVNFVYFSCSDSPLSSLFPQSKIRFFFAGPSTSFLSSDYKLTFETLHECVKEAKRLFVIVSLSFELKPLCVAILGFSFLLRPSLLKNIFEIFMDRKMNTRSFITLNFLLRFNSQTLNFLS